MRDSPPPSPNGGIVETLREAEQEMRMLNVALEHAVEGISRFDTLGRYVSVNRAYAGMLGYQPEELTGMSWQLGVHLNDLEKAMVAYEFMLSHGRAEIELLGTRKDRSMFWKHIVMVKARNQQGDCTGHYAFMKDITDRKQAEEAQREYADRLQILSRRIVEVQEEERRHLASELHDEIGQVLSAISINLQASIVVCPASAWPRLEESIQIVDQALQQVRNLSLDLRPSMLDDLGLVSTLRWYADRQAQRSGFILHFLVESPGIALPADLQTACYRVVQEALTNVSRHAQASHVWLEFRQREEEVDLLVRDDGIGFDVAAVRTKAMLGASFGVLGMQERAELLGGQFSIESRPGSGTTIRVHCLIHRLNQLKPHSVS